MSDQCVKEELMSSVSTEVDNLTNEYNTESSKRLL